MLGSLGLWSSSKGMVLVPELSGLTDTQAVALIQSSGLTFSLSSSVDTSNESLSNKVASQLPIANELVPYESSVSFIYYNYVPVSTTTTTTTTSAPPTTTTTTSTPAPTPAPIVANISNLTYTRTGATTGTLSWSGTNINVYRYTGIANLYPPPYNYGTYTASWPGNLVNLVDGQSYTVTVDVRSVDGLGNSQTITFTHQVSTTTTTTTTASPVTCGPCQTYTYQQNVCNGEDLYVGNFSGTRQTCSDGSYVVCTPATLQSFGDCVAINVNSCGGTGGSGTSCITTTTTTTTSAPKVCGPQYGSTTGAVFTGSCPDGSCPGCSNYQVVNYKCSDGTTDYSQTYYTGLGCSSPTTSTSTTTTTTTTATPTVTYYQGYSSCNLNSGCYSSMPSVSGPFTASSMPFDTTFGPSTAREKIVYRSTSAAALADAALAGCVNCSTTTTTTTTSAPATYCRGEVRTVSQSQCPSYEGNFDVCYSNPLYSGTPVSSTFVSCVGGATTAAPTTAAPTTAAPTTTAGATTTASSCTTPGLQYNYGSTSCLGCSILSSGSGTGNGSNVSTPCGSFYGIPGVPYTWKCCG